MKNAIQSVDFHGKIIPTIQHDGKHYVGMKAICENIGLGWQGQHERIRRHVVLQEGVRVIRIPSNGGEQDSVTFDVSKLAKGEAYEYYCSFPGHYATMNGKLTLVD